MRTLLLSSATALVLLFPSSFAPSGGLSEALADSLTSDEQKELLAALTGTQLTLEDGIKQVSGSEMPNEAKFEMEDGKLMLSVYTSEKGVDTIPEENVFKEYKGPAEDSWKPEAEVFQDFEHIARSAQYHTLLSMTDQTLPGIIEKASAGGDTVLSVKAKVREKKPVFEVLSVSGRQVKESLYDLITGEPISG